MPKMPKNITFFNVDRKKTKESSFFSNFKDESKVE